MEESTVPTSAETKPALSPIPTVYERNINVKVIEAGSDHVRVQASLFDLEHNFHAELMVEVTSGRIEAAVASMTRRPYPTYCLRALDNVAKLKGQVIGPGINRRIVELVGRRTGCVHLVEIFHAAVGFTATILIGKRAGTVGVAGLSEEEDRKAWLPILRNSCQVFHDDSSSETKT
jgi:hypothetical protein